MVKRIVMIIAPSRFRDEELFQPKDIFHNLGYYTMIASKEPGLAVGMLGGTADAKLNYKDVSAEDFDAVVFVGGAGASVYFNDPVAHKIAQDFAQQKKVIAAICIAPSIIANAGILKGKQATSYGSESLNLRSKGAFYVNEDVVIDKNIITAKGPQAAEAFGRAVAKALGAKIITELKYHKNILE
jgi:protease I